MAQTRRRPGASAFRTSTRLGVRSVARLDTPVRFPPGRATSATRPSDTRSPTTVKTMGIFWVAPLAARAAASPGVEIRSKRRVPRADPVRPLDLLGEGVRRVERRDRGQHRQDGQDASLHHWTTWSARIRTDGGIVSPSALAVFRLTISSNFVGCSMGRARGLAPFRILSTYTAARRNNSGMLGP